MSNTNQIQVFGRLGRALAGFFLAGYASAQTPGTGTIEGRVFNASNGSYRREEFGVQYTLGLKGNF